MRAHGETNGHQNNTKQESIQDREILDLSKNANKPTATTDGQREPICQQQQQQPSNETTCTLNTSNDSDASKITTKIGRGRKRKCGNDSNLDQTNHNSGNEQQCINETVYDMDYKHWANYKDNWIPVTYSEMSSNELSKTNDMPFFKKRKGKDYHRIKAINNVHYFGPNTRSFKVDWDEDDVGGRGRRSKRERESLKWRRMKSGNQKQI